MTYKQQVRMEKLRAKVVAAHKAMDSNKDNSKDKALAQKWLKANKTLDDYLDKVL